MKLKFLQALLIGIGCSFLTGCIAQLDTSKFWCDGIEVNTYIRSATDCRLWIRCNGPNTSPSSGVCPNPSYFSAELQKCTSKDAANCIACPDTATTSYQSVAKSCSRFIRCKDGIASDMSCGIGMGFNPETNKCEPGYFKICTSTTTTAAPSTATSTTITAEEIDITSSIISSSSSTDITVTPWNPIES